MVRLMNPCGPVVRAVCATAAVFSAKGIKGVVNLRGAAAGRNPVGVGALLGPFPGQPLMPAACGL